MNEQVEWDLAAMMQSPMLEPLHPVLARLAELACESGATPDSFPSLALCNDLLATQQPSVRVANGMPLRFVAQETGSLPFERQYEPRCYLKGELQTREQNWHDLFNALVWLTFPKAKAAINARHYASLAAATTDGGSQRGRGRDMLTLLDESGVIVACADDGLASLLREFRWKDLFWRRRARLAGRMEFFVFGHGLQEKTLNPYIGITGQGLILSVSRGYFHLPLEGRLAYLDEALSSYLDSASLGLNPRELTPVPLLGVPGWSAESVREDFYDNARYFRPGRLLSKAKVSDRE